MNLTVATVLFQEHRNPIKIVWSNVACNDPQGLKLQFVQFVLRVDDVTAAIATDVYPVYGLATPVLVAPDTNLSIDTAFTKIGLPVPIPDTSTDDRLFALHAMHVREGTHSVNEVPGVDPSGILRE